MAPGLSSAANRHKALRGRAALELRVRSFGYRDAREYWGIEDPAAGESSPTKIGGLLGRPATSLAHQLNTLASAGFTDRRHDLLLDQRPVVTVADPDGPLPSAGASYAIIAVIVLVLSARLPLASRPTAPMQAEMQRPLAGLRGLPDRPPIS